MRGKSGSEKDILLAVGMTLIARWLGTLVCFLSQSTFSIYMFLGRFCMLCGGEFNNICSEKMATFEKIMVLSTFSVAIGVLP